MADIDTMALQRIAIDVRRISRTVAFWNAVLWLLVVGGVVIGVALYINRDTANQKATFEKLYGSVTSK